MIRPSASRTESSTINTSSRSRTACAVMADTTKATPGCGSGSPVTSPKEVALTGTATPSTSTAPTQEREVAARATTPEAGRVRTTWLSSPSTWMAWGVRLQNGPRESPLRKGWDESGARLLAIQPMETGGPNGPTVSFASCPRYATKQMFYFLAKMLDIFQLQHIIYTWKRDISIATPVCP